MVPNVSSRDRHRSPLSSVSGLKTGDAIANEPTEACKAFVTAMKLMSMNLTEVRVKCCFHPEGLVEVRQVFLRILGLLISHCKTIYALEAVVAILRRWILGKNSHINLSKLWGRPNLCTFYQSYCRIGETGIFEKTAPIYNAI